VVRVVSVPCCLAFAELRACSSRSAKNWQQRSASCTDGRAFATIARPTCGDGGSSWRVNGRAPRKLPAYQAPLPDRQPPDQPSPRLAAVHLGAARGELLQQRGEFSLDLNHMVGFGQISLQPRVLTFELGHLLITRIIARPTGWRC